MLLLHKLFHDPQNLFFFFFFANRLLLRDTEKFLMDDLYANPGPIQYKGLGADSKTISLCVEDQDYMGRVKELQSYLDKV